jgi:DNA polymerase III delta prime subunit
MVACAISRVLCYSPGMTMLARASEPNATTLAQRQLGQYLHLTLLCLKAHVAQYAHRMGHSAHAPEELLASFEASEAVLDPDETDNEEPVVSVEGWPTLAEIRTELALQRETMAAEAARYRDGAQVGRLPIENLRRLFRLSEQQLHLLIAAAAPVMSVDLSGLYAVAYRNPGTREPSVGFLSELLAPTPLEIAEVTAEFRGDSPLVRYRLIELADVPAWGMPTPLIHRAVRIPDRIVAYLQGHSEPLAARIADTCQLVSPRRARPAEQLVLPEQVRHDVKLALDHAVKNEDGRPRLLFVGPEGTGRATTLGSFLAPHGWGVLTADLGRLLMEGERFEQSLEEICREALLRRCLLLIRGGGILADRNQLVRLARPMGRVLEPYEGPLAVSVTEASPLVHRVLGGLYELELPLPLPPDQRALWVRAAAEAGCRIADDAPVVLTQRFNVAPGTIHRAVEEARSRASLFVPGSESVPLKIDDIAAAIRRHTVHALGSIAQPFGTSLDWDDVVLPEPVLKTLQEILAHARHREKVYEEWGFGRKVGYGRGLSCLFGGPPGTGKTMMAAVLAKTLGKELYRVDLSRVVSKWVGETEKNLSIAFDEAERGQLILLFDEADALFSKRTKGESSNDRFANMEINYLLQRMESYDGMTVLTTNKEQSMDEAFTRRIKFKVHFPMPDAELRAKLWASMIPPEMAVERDLPFKYLGQEFEMAGGHIKNAVLRSAFYAAESGGVITGDLLYEAAIQEAREMGMVVREVR